MYVFPTNALLINAEFPSVFSYTNARLCCNSIDILTFREEEIVRQSTREIIILFSILLTVNCEQFSNKNETVLSKATKYAERLETIK